MTRRILRSGHESLEFVERPRGGGGEPVEFTDLRAAMTRLARFLAAPSDAAVLRRLAGSLTRGEPVHDDRDVLARIAAALVTGRISLVRPGPRREPLIAASADSPEIERPDDFELLRQRPPETHWIEIQLLDEDGVGIEGQHCRLTDGEEILHDGYTDGTGVARWTRLPPGPCKVQFPGLDATPRDIQPRSDPSVTRGVTLAQGAPTPPPPLLRAPDHWIEIQLVDEGGVGLAGHRCLLVAGDGVERPALTGPDGVARWTHLPPGRCRVCFPDIDAESWEDLTDAP